MDDRIERLKREYDDWLRRFSWCWFGTLKITSGMPSERRAKKMFDDWIADLGAKEGTENFRWVRVIERGGSGRNLHFHVLVGGLRNRLQYWERRWNEIGGDALIGKFDPEKNGILYFLKEMDEEGNLDIDFCLPKRQQSAPAERPHRRSGGSK